MPAPLGFTWGTNPLRARGTHSHLQTHPSLHSEGQRKIHSDFQLVWTPSSPPSLIPNSHFEAFSAHLYGSRLKFTLQQQTFHQLQPPVPPTRKYLYFNMRIYSCFVLADIFLSQVLHTFWLGEPQRVHRTLMSRSITGHKKRYCLFKGYLKVDCYLIAYILQNYSALWMNLTFLYLLGEKKKEKTKRS